MRLCLIRDEDKNTEELHALTEKHAVQYLES